MRRIFTFVIGLILLASAPGRSQIMLVGAASNSSSGGIDILQWEALDPASVTVHPSILQGYYLASSAFDAFNGLYYLQGISADTSGLFSFNTSTGEQLMSPFTSFTNISEFDMSTGRIYDLHVNPGGIIRVSEFNLATGTDSVIALVSEPGIEGLVVDAITFDANNGILYYAGPDGNDVRSLFGFHVRENPCTWTKVPVTGAAERIELTSLNFDNVSGALFALERDFSLSGTYLGSMISGIDVATGAVTPRGALTGFDGFVLGSSSFDQDSESFLLVAIDMANQFRMIVFNTLTNTYVSGFVPDGVSEVACDNTEFVRRFYITGVRDISQEPGISIYPNPVQDVLNLLVKDTPDTYAVIELISPDGVSLLHSVCSTNEPATIDVSDLTAGFYVVKVTSDTRVVTRKVIVR